jgi:hypothetical protein
MTDQMAIRPFPTAYKLRAIKRARGGRRGLPVAPKLGYRARRVVAPTRAGAGDRAVETEEDAFASARFLSYLASPVYELPPTLPCADNPERTEEALMNAVPRNRKQVCRVQQSNPESLRGDAWLLRRFRSSQ